MSKSPEPYSVSIRDAGPYIGVGQTKIKELLRRSLLHVSYPLRKPGQEKSKGVIRTEELRRLVDSGVIERVDLSNIQVQP